MLFLDIRIHNLAIRTQNLAIRTIVKAKNESYIKAKRQIRMSEKKTVNMTYPQRLISIMPARKDGCSTIEKRAHDQ